MPRIMQTAAEDTAVSTDAFDENMSGLLTVETDKCKNRLE